MLFKKIKEKVIEQVEELYDTTKKDYIVELKPGKNGRKVSPKRDTNHLKKWASKNH